MRHLAHLVRADVRRFAVLLAVWVLLQLADTIVSGLRPALATDMKLATTFELLGTVLFMTRWLGMIVIVALVVQTHALVGSDAFWMSRPIHWRALLASKLVLLGATFVVVPMLCETGLMLASRIPISDIPPIALQTVLFQCLWLSLFMALAAITRNLARLALIAGSLLVGLSLLLNVMIAVMLRDLPDGPRLIEVTPRTMSSPAAGVAILLMLIGTAIAFVAAQYRTRLVRVAVIAGAAGFGVTVLIALAWPWPTRLMPVPAWATSDTAVTLGTTSPQGQFRPLEHDNPWSSGGAWLIGAVELRVGGVEEGWRASARLESASVSFTDGTTLATAGNAYSSALRLASVDDAPEDAIARLVLGVRRLLETALEHMSGATTDVIVLTQADFDKYQGAIGTYRGQYVVDLDRVVVAATLPLQAGGVFQGHRHRIVVDQVNAQGPTAAVRLRQFTSATIFGSEQQPATAFYLRNRSAGEAVAGAPRMAFGMTHGVPLPIVSGGYWAGSETGFHVTSSVIQFPARYGMNGKRVDLSAEWLSQAELVILYTIPGGSVTRTVEVPGFMMIPAPVRSDTAIGGR
jgi:hypothetical protein